jgi:hypothetical protein
MFILPCLQIQCLTHLSEQFPMLHAIQDTEGAQESIPGLHKRLQIQAQLVQKIK